jgi:hypothetical protein
LAQSSTIPDNAAMPTLSADVLVLLVVVSLVVIRGR